MQINLKDNQSAIIITERPDGEVTIMVASPDFSSWSCQWAEEIAISMRAQEGVSDCEFEMEH